MSFEDDFNRQALQIAEKTVREKLFLHGINNVIVTAARMEDGKAILNFEGEPDAIKKAKEVLGYKI